MKDLISVIIPVYKVERFLDECVQSIVSQSYKSLEIILVDDGSPDNCGVICDNWAEKDRRLRRRKPIFVHVIFCHVIPIVKLHGDVGNTLWAILKQFCPCCTAIQLIRYLRGTSCTAAALSWKISWRWTQRCAGARISSSI